MSKVVDNLILGLNICIINMVKKMKKENIIKTVALLTAIIAIFIGYIYKKTKTRNLKETEGITVVPTMYDEISNDAAWSPTFELIWNDLKNEIVKQDIVFEEKNDIVDNLNKEYFQENMINSNYYYKKYGLKTLKLKEEIEKGIKEKFNQESDILNDFNWSNEELDQNDPNLKRYFFYSMLYREFEYKYKFDKLEESSFKDKNNIKYFGINKNTGDKVKSQITVLFYNNQDDFGISIKTKNNDEVIFYKNPEGKTFNEIYDNLLKKQSTFTDATSLRDTDTFKVPYLDFKVKKEYTELEERIFKTLDGDDCKIIKAIQSIEFQINETGGKVKSEAGMDVNKELAIKPTEPRYFNVDDTFALFLKESTKEVPYFALKVDDITKYQQ